MIKRFIIAIVLLTLLCGGLVGFNLFRDRMIAGFFANMPKQTMVVSTVEVKPVRWEPGIEAVGTVVASQGVDVASQASGVIRKISFEANDRVAAGAVLVEIDREVEEAELIAARAAVQRDQRNLDRARELASRGVASAATLEDAQAQLDTSRSTLERIKAILDQKVITAPFAGTIGIPRVDPGEYITPGTVIATLQDLDTMKVNFTVPEQQLGQIQRDQQALFGMTRDRLSFRGRISGIEPKIDPASRLVSVQASVENPDGGLRPGQFINVRVQLPAEDNVIALPQTAVVPSLYGSYVYVVEKEEKTDEAGKGAQPAGSETLTARQVFVGVGRRNAESIEIISGLKPGAVVVTAGQNRLSNGNPVSIDNTVDPTKPETAGATASAEGQP